MCLVGVVVRRYIDILILLIPTPLVSALFCSSIIILIFSIKHRGVYFFQAASRCDVYLRAAFIRGRCLLISYNPVDSQLKL